MNVEEDVERAVNNITAQFGRVKELIELLWSLLKVMPNVSCAIARNSQTCGASRKELHKKNGVPTSNWASLECWLTAVTNKESSFPCRCGGIKKGDKMVALCPRPRETKKKGKAKNAINAVQVIVNPFVTLPQLQEIYPNKTIIFRGTCKDTGMARWVMDIHRKAASFVGEHSVNGIEFEIKRQPLMNTHQGVLYNFENPSESIQLAKKLKQDRRDKAIAEYYRKNQEPVCSSTSEFALIATNRDVLRDDYDADDPRSPFANEDHRDNVSIANDC